MGNVEQPGIYSQDLGLCGDFNTVRCSSEKKNCSRISKSTTDFSKFIEDMKMVDLDLTGGLHLEARG